MVNSAAQNGLVGVLFHLATPADWAEGLENGVYRAESLATEGFIHCSSADQYVATANGLFRGRRDLVLLFIDDDRLDVPVRWENGFPHVYGPLPLSSVFEAEPFASGPDGVFAPHSEGAALVAKADQTLEAISEQALAAMSGFGRPWWVSGGWSVDLALGRRTRPHADLEISLLTSDQPALFDHLEGWDRRAVVDGQVVVWDGTPVKPPYHQILARPWLREGDDVDAFFADPRMLDMLVEDHDGDDWLFRRDHRIRMPISEAGHVSPLGVPCIRPDITLLFKAKYRRHKDQRDFDALLPHLDSAAREWLSGALTVTNPGHSWIDRLA